MPMATGAGARSPGGRRRVVVMVWEREVECAAGPVAQGRGRAGWDGCGGGGGSGGDGGDGGVWVGGRCDGVDELW